MAIYNWVAVLVGSCCSMDALFYSKRTDNARSNLLQTFILHTQPTTIYFSSKNISLQLRLWVWEECWKNELMKDREGSLIDQKSPPRPRPRPRDGCTKFQGGREEVSVILRQTWHINQIKNMLQLWRRKEKKENKTETRGVPWQQESFSERNDFVCANSKRRGRFQSVD